MFSLLSKYPSKPSAETQHRVLKQIKMIPPHPRSFVTWSIRRHCDSWELWPPLNGIIPHVHSWGCVGCLRIILPPFSVTTSVHVIIAQASSAGGDVPVEHILRKPWHCLARLHIGLTMLRQVNIWFLMVPSTAENCWSEYKILIR